MSNDIFGYVEVYNPKRERWLPDLNLGQNIGRNYDMFGSLFGVKNYANFRPIAPRRGLPEDVSEVVAKASTTRRKGKWSASSDNREHNHSHTWISLQEIEAIDWAEPATAADSRLHQYERDEGGQWVYRGKAAYDHLFQARIAPDYDPRMARFHPRVWPEGQQWETNGVLYRAEVIRRADAVDVGWHKIFDHMRKLGERHGVEHVRLVVWFNEASEREMFPQIEQMMNEYMKIRQTDINLVGNEQFTMDVLVGSLELPANGMNLPTVGSKDGPPPRKRK